MAWLIFITAKSNIKTFVTNCLGRLANSNQNLADLAFILAAIFCFVVKYAPTEVTCEVNESKEVMKVKGLLFRIQERLP